MTSADRWKEISSLFNEALNRPPDQRAAFLAGACPDEALRNQVTALLECEAPAGQFLDASMADLGGVNDAAGALVGQHLGAYRVDGLLGAGGMGTVYKATDTRLDRTVAIKILPPSFKDASIWQQRFEREARAIAGLRHPHICVLHDVGREGDTQFLVMEYLEGETLGARLARGALPLPEVIRHATEIASALVEMHAHGVIHRDLKPANIMLTKTGAKVLDFGLARLDRQPAEALPAAPADAVPGDDHAADTFGQTSRAGTLSYMAPEQVRGDAVTPQADIFAFGAILYEMVTGAKAFSGPDAGAVANAILHHDPPALPAASGVPAGFEALFRRCLHKVPGERPHAQAVFDALQAQSSTSLPRHGRRAAWVALALVGAALAGGALVWRAGSNASAGGAALAAVSSETSRLVLENVRLLAADDELELSPSLSPDGRSIAYSRGTVTRVQAVVRSLEGGSPRPLHPEQNTQNQARWSPDGENVLYIGPEGVYVAPTSGGTPRLLVARMLVGDKKTDSAVRGSLSAAAWSPDGKQIAVADNSDRSLSIVSLADGRRQRIATARTDLHGCDWSPNGRWIACAADNWGGQFAGLGYLFGNFAASAIVIVGAAGGDIRELTDFSAMNQSPAWSADSRRLYFVSNRARTFDIYAQAIDAEGNASAPARRLTTGLGAWSLTFSLDRTRLAYTVSTARANLWSLLIPTAGVTSLADASPLTRGNQMIESMRVSRSGKWVVYDSNLAGTFDIYRVPVGGGEPERLTTEPGDEFLADLASDDRSIVYQSWLTTTRDLYVKAVGPSRPVQITNYPGHEAQPAWSPDGNAIVYSDFTNDRGVINGTHLLRRDAGGTWGAPRALRRGGWRPSWSPDGTFLGLSTGNAVEVLSLDSGEARLVYRPRPNSTDPRAEDVIVGDDGRTLYFKAKTDTGQSQIWSVPVAGGPPRLLVEFGDRLSTRTDLGAGAGRFFFTIDERRSNIWVADVREQ